MKLNEAWRKYAVSTLQTSAYDLETLRHTGPAWSIRDRISGIEDNIHDLLDDLKGKRHE